MYDFEWPFDGDIASSVQGDILPISGLAYSTQRITKLLFTNPGDYLAHPTYGVGVRKYIGQTMGTQQLFDLESAIVRGLALEPSVAKTPTPNVNITFNAAAAQVYCEITYTDALLKVSNVIPFTIPINP